MKVAVSFSEGSLGDVLEKLHVLASECSRVRGVGKQMAFLSSELTAMHALLRKVAAMEEPVDVQVQAWARDVREMAYDVEDCVDAFSRQQRLSSSRGGAGIKQLFRRCSELLGKLRKWRQFASQIDELKARVVEIAECRDRYRLDDLATAAAGSSSSGVDPQLAALFVDEDHLVGIDGPRDELARWLLEDGGSAKHLKVLSIVGFGGLGKTTLANQVYRKIRGDFTCKAFVSVSQKPNLKLILRNCLRQLCPRDGGFTKKIETWDEVEIITNTREYLAERRYLVVIDDLWSTKAWDDIKCAFPKNICSSRIITTTRIVQVAGMCSHMDGRVYEMEHLNDIYSRRLFLKRIFGSEECPIQFQEVSDQILKKCGGLPLAIIAISSLLANKPAVKEEWEKVKDAIGSALERHKGLEAINAILTLSYNDLPHHHLKTCMLYLSIFPEDYNITRNELVNRWIAEGFIPQEWGQSLHDVAESYFYELINKSMIQPIHVGCDGKVYACRIHDIMLELIVSKASEENFITMLTGSQASIAYHPQYNIRRLTIQQAEKEFSLVLEGNDLSHVRSLTAVGAAKYLPPLVRFDVLRVLDFRGCTGLDDYDWSNIDKLTQLKYLSLRDTGILELPSGIVKLHDLETLDIWGTNIQELPVGIVHLTKVQYLALSQATKLPDGTGNMRNLQVLSGLHISMSSACALEDLGNSTSLKDLHIVLNAEGHGTNNRHEEMLLSSLCKLGRCKLQDLYIDSVAPMEFLDCWLPPPTSLQLFVMRTSYYFPKLPKWIVPELTSLAHLNINLFEVTQDDLRTLGGLHALLQLELWFKKDSEERLTVCRGEFQFLKQFYFIPDHFTTTGAGYLVFENGALPKLEKLKLPFSASMAKDYNFYLGIEHLTCLKEVEINIRKEGATPSESNAAATAIRNEANALPNHPRVIIRQYE